MADTITTFAAEAQAFCDWLIQGKEAGADAAREALRRLLRLYASALALPDDHDADLSGNGKRVSQEQWSEAHRSCGRFPVQYYSEIFNPLMVPPEEPVVGDLGDDLADIFGELRKGLDLYSAGNVGGAVWSWRFSLRCHWGEHATGAIRALHCWLAQNYEIGI